MCRSSTPSSASPKRTSHSRAELKGENRDSVVETSDGESTTGSSSCEAHAESVEHSFTANVVALAKVTYSRELLLGIRQETKDDDRKFPIFTISLHPNPFGEHDDEKLLSALEGRLSRESGADERNAETFPDSCSSGWSYQEAVEANAMLARSAAPLTSKATQVFATKPGSSPSEPHLAVRAKPSLLRADAPAFETHLSNKATPPAASPLRADAPGFEPSSSPWNVEAPCFKPAPSRGELRAQAPVFKPEKYSDDSEQQVATQFLEVLSTTPSPSIARAWGAQRNPRRAPVFSTVPAQGPGVWKDASLGKA